MKKYIIPCLFILTLATAGCKKKTDPLPTTMTFVIDKDTAWTTTNVITDSKNAGIIYITGTNKDGTESLDIAITGFNGSKGTFLVDYRGPGGNMTGNTGMYKKGAEIIAARVGKIVVTGLANNLITGTFDFYYLQTNFKGSFSAPAQ